MNPRRVERGVTYSRKVGGIGRAVRNKLNQLYTESTSRRRTVQIWFIDCQHQKTFVLWLLSIQSLVEPRTKHHYLGKRFMACVAFNWTNHKTYKLRISFPAIIIGVSKSQDHHHQPIRKCVTTAEWRKVNWRKQQSYTSQV